MQRGKNKTDTTVKSSTYKRRYRLFHHKIETIVQHWETFNISCITFHTWGTIYQKYRTQSSLKVKLQSTAVQNIRPDIPECGVRVEMFAAGRMQFHSYLPILLSWTFVLSKLLIISLQMWKAFLQHNNKHWIHLYSGYCIIKLDYVTIHWASSNKLAR